MLCFFFNDTATTEIYTLSLHDALPISRPPPHPAPPAGVAAAARRRTPIGPRSRGFRNPRSEEHTSELQSRSDLVCRLLLEKKKKKKATHIPQHPCVYIMRRIHCDTSYA